MSSIWPLPPISEGMSANLGRSSFPFHVASAWLMCMAGLNSVSRMPETTSVNPMVSG